jgi:hypothetical protein
MIKKFEKPIAKTLERVTENVLQKPQATLTAIKKRDS